MIRGRGAAAAGDYRDRIKRIAGEARLGLIARGVSADSVDFDSPIRRGRRPGNARSEFLANRAMGDWAESALQAAYNALHTGCVAAKYGNADRIVAGDEDFPDFYDAYQAELATIGKRPDLLLLPEAIATSLGTDDISELPAKALNPVVESALAALEVRSSKVFSIEYERIRLAEGRKGARACHSFTPKVEDLKLVLKWIGRFGVPHYYVQVFFDAVYGVSFERILTILASGDGFDIERNRNNQEKPTIHIPIRSGVELGRFAKEPEFRAETRKTRLARLDAYVVPSGGDLQLDAAKVADLAAT
ncbi:MAG TPA: AccI family restriction endonuclease [Hyphomonadaceae bacterium]|nr:AccI family restriction endonuclease [Hyphomonadaceae bacterium]